MIGGGHRFRSRGHLTVHRLVLQALRVDKCVAVTGPRVGLLHVSPLRNACVRGVFLRWEQRANSDPAVVYLFISVNRHEIDSARH